MFYDAIIVLGQRIQEGEIPEELVRRVEKAAQCWIDGLSPAIIPCGGQRPDEEAPEALVMAQLLEQFGVAPSVIRPELESLNTEQNLANAWAMITGWGGKACLVVTSDYHLPRALAVCRDLGIKAKGVPVPTPGGPKRLKRWLTERLGWLEYRLGWQKKQNPGRLQRLIRRVTRT